MSDIAPLTFSRKNQLIIWGVGLAAGTLALTGCGHNSQPGVSPTSGSQATAASSRPDTSPSTQTSESPMLVFDALGGGSSIIRVYNGVTDAPADKSVTGTFNDGDSVTANCKKVGRTVHSDTSVGEIDRTSSDWIRIDATPGQVQYATAVYIQDPSTLLKQLRTC